MGGGRVGQDVRERRALISTFMAQIWGLRLVDTRCQAMDYLGEEVITLTLLIRLPPPQTSLSLRATREFFQRWGVWGGHCQASGEVLIVPSPSPPPGSRDEWDWSPCSKLREVDFLPQSPPQQIQPWSQESKPNPVPANPQSLPWAFRGMELGVNVQRI